MEFGEMATVYLDMVKAYPFNIIQKDFDTLGKLKQLYYHTQNKVGFQFDMKDGEDKNIIVTDKIYFFK